MRSVSARAWLQVLIVCCAVLGVICEDAVAAAEPERTQLRLWNYWPPNVRVPIVSIRREIFIRFLEEHPHIEVITGHAMSFMGGQSETGRFMAMASGTAPNVLLLSTRQLSGYIEQGVLRPLDEYLVGYEPWKPIPQGFLEAATEDGKLYAVPAILVVELPEITSSYTTVRTNELKTGLQALVYRKDMFLEVGLDPEHPPETWEELYDYAKRLTRKNVTVKSGPSAGQKHDKVWGFGLVRGKDIGYQFANFVWQNGGELARRTERGWTCAFDEPPAVEALEFLQKMVYEPFEKDGKTYYGAAVVGGQGNEPSMYHRFVRGEVAMIIDKPEAWRNLEYNHPEYGLSAANVGVALLPAGRADRVSVRQDLCWTITAQSTDPKVNAAAWEYIRYLNSEETARFATTAVVELGKGATIREPEFLKRFGFTHEYESIGEQYRTISRRIEDHSRLEPPVPGWQQISEVELRTALEKALTVSPTVDAGEVLREAASRADALLLGAMPDQVRSKSRALTVLLFVVLVVTLGVFIYKLRAIFIPGQPQLGEEPLRGRTHTVAWVYLLPAVLSVAVWGYFPLARGLGMAFYDYRLFGDKQFIWFENFTNAFGQPLFWQSLGNTFWYVFLSLAFGFLIPLILAIFLSEVPRGKYLFRVLYYLPAVIAPVVALIMWREMIFDPEPWGALNRVLQSVGLPPQRWLRDPAWAMACVVLPGIWAGAGPGSLIYLAALKSIPEDIYEAAELDNAGLFRKVRHITIPHLLPLVIMNLVGAFVGAFQTTQNIFVMTEGGPLNATRTIGLEIFYNAFFYLKFGYATAMAWIMGSMLIGFTLFNLRILRSVEFSRAR